MSNDVSFASLHASLLKNPPPLLPPPKAQDPSLTAKISSLQLHPDLEAALHILNLDLPSAHFLARHMSSAPAYEGMYLHGILHRIEGDYDNARMWYSDVQESEVYAKVWGGRGTTFKEIKDGESKKAYDYGGEKETELNDGQKFLNKVQKFKVSKGKEGSKEELEKESRRELETVIDFCIKKFGTGKMVDASEAFQRPNEENKKIGQDQVSGDAGRRNF